MWTISTLCCVFVRFFFLFFSASSSSLEVPDGSDIACVSDVPTSLPRASSRTTSMTAAAPTDGPTAPRTMVSGRRESTSRCVQGCGGQSLYSLTTYASASHIAPHVSVYLHVCVCVCRLAMVRSWLRMHGEGCYTDPDGVAWKGTFYAVRCVNTRRWISTIVAMLSITLSFSSLGNSLCVFSSR